MFALHIALLGISILLLARIAVDDWRLLRIRNSDLLVLLVLAVLVSALRIQAGEETYFETVVRLAVTVISFALLFALWMAGGFGAGDAKLVPICVLLVSSASWFWFALGLIGCTIVIIPLIRFFPANASIPDAKRQGTLKPTRVLPYGAVACPAAMLAMCHEIYLKFFIYGHGVLYQL